MIAMTLNVKKTLRASLDKVAVRVMDGLRRREDRVEWEPDGPEPRQVLRPSLKKKKNRRQAPHLRKQRRPPQLRARQDPKTLSKIWWKGTLGVFGALLKRTISWRSPN